MLSFADGSSCTFQIPEMRNFRCVETPTGLVLIVDSASLQSFLWNPQTGEKLALPAMDKALPDRCQCHLSDSITAPDCLALVCNLGESELLFCQVSGGDTWFSLSYDIGYYTIPEGCSDPQTKMLFGAMAAMNGKFYLANAPNRDQLGVLSLSHDPEPRMEINYVDAPLPKLETDALQVVSGSYLLESSQELYMVCIFYLLSNVKRIEEVGAYRMDFDKHEWCKVTDIGDRAFLIGRENFAASCSATEQGLKRGCVYVAYNELGDDEGFHIFDLMEGTREVGGPPQDVQDVYYRSPFWMVPVLPW